MISFDIGDIRFNYRCAGIFHHEGRVLLHRARCDDFWALPGGRCEPGETAKQAVARELDEELGVSVTVERLLFVVENFFDYEARSFHEVGMYFEACFVDGCSIVERRGPWSPETEPELIFCWFDHEALSHICVKPPFLTEYLFNLPSYPVHMVIDRRVVGELP